MSTSEFRIDLEKLASVEHHAYFLRLLWALNDILSTIQACDATESSSNTPEAFKKHILAYLLRIQQAHLVEACKSLVYLVKPKGRKAAPEYNWISTQHLAINQKFDALLTLLEDPQYQAMRELRDSHVFHYNHEDKSKETVEAIKQLSSHWNKFKKQGSRELNLIERTDSTVTTRYYVADHMIMFAWLNALKIGSGDDQGAAIKFHGKVLGAFLDYAEDAFLEWIDENRLSSKV